MRKLLYGAAVAVLCSFASHDCRAGSRVANGTISAAAPAGCADANALVITTVGFNSLGISIASAFDGALQIAGTEDGTQFVPLHGFPLGGGKPTSTLTGPGQWTLSATNLYQVCIYASALNSGTPAIVIDTSLQVPRVLRVIPTDGVSHASFEAPGMYAGAGDTGQVVILRDVAPVRVVSSPLNPFLPRCNAVRQTNCQP